MPHNNQKWLNGKIEHITLEQIKAIALPGDIIIGRFPGPLEYCVSPIILIGDCVECILGKENILNGIEFYLKQEEDKYIKYRLVR